MPLQTPLFVYQSVFAPMLYCDQYLLRTSQHDTCPPLGYVRTKFPLSFSLFTRTFHRSWLTTHTASFLCLLLPPSGCLPSDPHSCSCISTTDQRFLFPCWIDVLSTYHRGNAGLFAFTPPRITHTILVLTTRDVFVLKYLSPINLLTKIYLYALIIYVNLCPAVYLYDYLK